MTVPTGLSISGNPITTSGTLAVSLDTGYKIPLDASLDDFQEAYLWGDHSAAGYALASVVEEVSAYAADLSTFAANVSTRLNATNENVADVSAYAIDLSTNAHGRIDSVSTYAIEVSTRLDSYNTALNTRIANVSTYAIEVSTRLDSYNSALNTRIANVSTYAINVSTYSANVSTRLTATNASVNTKFGTVDASMQQIFNINSSQESIWAAAWDQLFFLNSSLVRPTNY